MATNLDYPSNCATNVYTLNDFGEIAYIVCTVATPPSQDPAAFVSTPEATLARLRKTERQFREVSILAALDVDNRQLFTFYKKVEITNAKDQKTLLTKFGYVLRSNTCTIAYKTAARLPDLMKPDQARLYRLFTIAIISSIKVLPNGDTAVQQFDPKLYVARRDVSESEVDRFGPKNIWSLYRIDLQIIPTGQIILTIVKDREHAFRRVLDVGQDFDLRRSAAPGGYPVYLAPLGRVARLVNNTNGATLTTNDYDEGQDIIPSHDVEQEKELWREVLPAWLSEHADISLDSGTITWVEVQVAVYDAEQPPADNTSVSTTPSGMLGPVSWKTLLWPSSLCFVPDNERPGLPEQVGGIQDPIRFVREWLIGTSNDNSNAHDQSHMANLADDDDDDEPLFAETGTFDDPEHFQPFGPPAFPASQTVYPTPPDAIMTHSVPGLSSVDGIAMTPANLPGKSSDSVRRSDMEMHDFDGMNNDSAMSGYYDEDLFDEMPEDQFGPGNPADEPNWDFFDRPGANIKAISATMTDPADVGVKDVDTIMNDIRGDAGTKAPSHENGIDANHVEQSAEVILPSEIIHHQESAGPVDHAEVSGSRKTGKIERGNPQTTQGVALDGGEQSSKRTGPRRRSSIYESVQRSGRPSWRDYKYTANGGFWFDPDPIAFSPNSSLNLSSVIRHSASSSSNDGESSDEDFSSPYRTSNGKKALVPSCAWTEYHPGSPATVTHQSEFDKAAAEADIKQLLAALKPVAIQPTPIVDFPVLDRALQTDEIVDRNFLQVAQIFVDQVSQTSLVPHADQEYKHKTLTDDHFDIIADLGGLGSASSPLTLSQLISLKADTPNVRPQGKISKLQPSQVCMKRAEQPLVASLPILSFWDTLNLQPAHGLKNAIAFCIHPEGEEVADGCSNLLQRMSDTYNSCALGLHSVGRLNNEADDGRISYNTTAEASSTVRQVCQRMGSMLATASDLSGTVLIYMVSEDDSPAAYLEMCKAFNCLFESFATNADKKNITDMALQIIPRRFVASPESLVVPSQQAYLKLALEVYNRLPPIEESRSPAASDAAITLAKAENPVHLQLASTFASPLSNNGDYLHLAYSATPDGRWITAAWADELGYVSLSMSYCTRCKDSIQGRPRQEVFREMWLVSHDLMSKNRRLWRLGIIKHGFYAPAELQEWRQIFESATAVQKRCSPMLLAASPEPELKVFPHTVAGKLVQAGQNIFGTPVSTPQAGVTSPDQHIPATPTPSGSALINAPTPPEPSLDPNVEVDLTLLDPAEESWGILLPYGLNQSKSIMDIRPALVSAVLLKRRGAKVEEGFISLEVSLVYLPPPVSGGLGQAAPDDLLEDIIKQYRGLLTLGVSRGCVDPSKETLPWHIATVVRGSKALAEAM
ncbi:hypothetical protein PV08_07363 [Exophiala spinifera]|uniref:Mediator of RNA polymerase II transcription subunit 13 n=1 Tax=Exophiala spinifera TaxID=91928 RepID=A0A0D2BTM5_9EURO|nr:uncharacterized protein PV08_07363 [Exophiala spinifera]KIW14579.1 hypothetical protein PV08_07363 [Exophiala spinifera]